MAAFDTSSAPDGYLLSESKTMPSTLQANECSFIQAIKTGACRSSQTQKMIAR